MPIDIILEHSLARAAIVFVYDVRARTNMTSSATNPSVRECIITIGIEWIETLVEISSAPRTKQGHTQ